MIHTQRRWCKHPSNLYILQEEPYLLIPEIPNAHLIHIRRDANSSDEFHSFRIPFFLYIYSTLIYSTRTFQFPNHITKQSEIVEAEPKLLSTGNFPLETSLNRRTDCRYLEKKTQQIPRVICKDLSLTCHACKS